MSMYGNLPKTNNPVELFEYLVQQRNNKALPKEEQDALFSKPIPEESSSTLDFFADMWDNITTKSKQAREEANAIMDEEALRSAEEAALFRMESGIKESLAEPYRKPTSDLAEGTSLRPMMREDIVSLGEPEGDETLPSVAEVTTTELEPAEIVDETPEERKSDSAPTSELPSNIDFEFIGQEEGYKTSMYVPNKDGVVYDSSGPTIGTGVDIGQRTKEGLKGLPKELRDKLEPYTNKRGQAALDFVDSNPLTLSQEEVATLNNWAKKEETASLIKLWNRDSDIAWEDLTKEQATAVASVMYQYGSKKVRTPKFWNAATSGDWTAAERELRNFGDKYTSRRLREADYLAGK